MAHYKGHKTIWAARGDGSLLRSHAVSNPTTRRAVCGVRVPDLGDDDSLTPDEVECGNCRRIVDRRSHRPRTWLALKLDLPDYQATSYGAFAIELAEVAADQRMTCYDHRDGQMFQAAYGFELPVAILHQQGNGVWMSTTQMEMEALVEPVRRTHGRVLTSGLGLGCFAWLAAQKRAVSSVTVVERDADLMLLMKTQLAHPKITYVVGDLRDYLAMDVAPYDFMFLDIWASITGPLFDALDMQARAARLLKPNGECRLWLQEMIDRVLHQLPDEPVVSAGPARWDMPPCLICSNTLRYDFAGLCMDCADCLQLSKMYIEGRRR